MKFSELFTIEAKKQMFKTYKIVRDLIGIESNFENFCSSIDKFSIDVICTLLRSISK